MSAKDLITIDMIRRVNEQIMVQGISNMANTPPHSEFLDRKLQRPVPVDAKTINDAWKKVREQFTA